MYTPEIVSHVVVKEKQRVEVSVNFVDGDKTHNKVFSFGLNVTELQVKRAIKNYLEELTLAETFTLTQGAIDVAEPVEVVVELTAAEKRAAKYQEKREALKILKEDVGLGLATQAEYDVELAAFITWRDR